MTGAVTGEEQRAAIAAAAASLFAERGYDAVSIDRIAAALGATKGLVYHHYGSKAEILAVVVTAALARRLAALEACGGDLAAMVRAAASLLVDDRAAQCVADAQPVERTGSADAIALAGAIEACWLAALREGVRAGRIRPVPPAFALALIRSSLAVAAAEWPRVPPERLAAATAEFIVAGLATGT